LTQWLQQLLLPLHLLILQQQQLLPLWTLLLRLLPSLLTLMQLWHPSQQWILLLLLQQQAGR
jgi:hypothetical protein